MNEHALSHHAQRRMQQRAIPPCVIDWLYEFGTRTHDRRGALIRYFDRAARQRLAGALPAQQMARFDQKLNAYLVESEDGTVITLGYRSKRMPRH